MRIDPIIRNLHESVPQVKKPLRAGWVRLRSAEGKDRRGETSSRTGPDAAMAEGAVNGASNVHETMIRLEEADISLRLLGKLRNRPWTPIMK